MAPLIMLLSSCDAATNANGIIWPKSYVAPNFDNLDLRNVMVPLTVFSISHNANTKASGIT